MTVNLKYSQAIAVYAFLQALAEQTEALSSDLQKKINQVGETFESDTETAVNSLLELAKHKRLVTAYEKVYQDTVNKYQPKEMNRYDSPDKQNQPDATPTEGLSNIAVNIFKDSDPVEKSKEKKQEIAVVADSCIH
ncbi:MULTISPECIES: hypothetical protein [Cyanophyceae]|uniref:hypothetical protein n=1 Tax=Cyanophyceae TaxID=3028117 RepID=UPI001685E1CE|nr:hypothetical protein [Trichocoleus sp. FACHB-40]MBD2006798.1 hypothetical protein [Trichocoleus sp. FACHB-40]